MKIAILGSLRDHKIENVIFLFFLGFFDFKP